MNAKIQNIRGESRINHAVIILIQIHLGIILTEEDVKEEESEKIGMGQKDTRKEHESYTTLA